MAAAKIAEESKIRSGGLYQKPTPEKAPGNYTTGGPKTFGSEGGGVTYCRP